jgi:hypothetical protein
MATIASTRDDLTAKLATTVSLLSTTMSNAIYLEDTRSLLWKMKSLEAKSDSWISPFSAHCRERERERERKRAPEDIVYGTGIQLEARRRLKSRGSHCQADRF